MNFKLTAILALGCTVLVSGSSKADDQKNGQATHYGKVEMSLIHIDRKGKEDRLESKDGEFFLNWNSNECEIKIKGGYAHCNFDRTQDLLNSKNELVMKAIPQAHFSREVMDSLIRTFGADSRSVRKIISQVVEETAASREKGFFLPFYTCGDCEKNGKDLVLWNAFRDSVTRDLQIDHVYGKYIFRMKLKDMKAIKGAFNIIGNSNASDFGR